MIQILLLAIYTVAGLVAGLVAAAALDELLEKRFPLWKKWAGRIFAVAVVVAAAAAMAAVFAGRGNGGPRLSPVRYAAATTEIACRLDLGRSEADEIEATYKAFLESPEERAQPFIAQMQVFSKHESSRVNRALDALDDLTKLGPPLKFIDDHETYVAVLRAYHDVLREISDRVPPNADQLPVDELLAIILSLSGEDPGGRGGTPVIRFDEIKLRVIAYRNAVLQAEYSEEFKDIISCKIRLTPIETTEIPTKSPTATMTPTPPTG